MYIVKTKIVEILLCCVCMAPICFFSTIWMQFGYILFCACILVYLSTWNTEKKNTAQQTNTNIQQNKATDALPFPNFRHTSKNFYALLPPDVTIGATCDDDVAEKIGLLWEENAQNYVLLSGIKEGVLSISPEGIVLVINDRAKKILHISKQIKLSTLPKDVPSVVLEAIVAAQKQQYFEGDWSEGVKPNKKYYEVVGLPTRTNGCILVLRDITKIRRLERVRRDFIANISHELRTPITTILMNLEALEEIDSNPFVEAITRNANRVRVLVDGLLDLSRIEAGKYEIAPQRLQLAPLVQKVCSILENKAIRKEQRIQQDIPPEIVVYLDMVALEQILSNLIDNAIKYTPNQSTIVIRARIDVVDGIQFKKNNVKSTEKIVYIEVEDNGMGIPSKHQPRIFERFYRVDKGRSREEGGTGLGLSIVKHLVETMHGDIYVRDIEPHGTVFTCVFPIKNI